MIRVSVVDEERQEAIAAPSLEVERHRLLPLTAPGLAGACGTNRVRMDPRSYRRTANRGSVRAVSPTWP